MEAAFFSQENERVATPEEREYVIRALASFGFYDASLDTYTVPEHPLDNQWAVTLDNNPDIILGNN